MPSSRTPTSRLAQIHSFAEKLLPVSEVGSFVESVFQELGKRPVVVWRDVPLLLWENEDISSFPLDLPAWVTIPKTGIRPGLFPEHTTGEYYCADLSSVILGLAWTRVMERSSSVVDLCAAPGGKAIIAWRALRPEILICNEVIRKRVRILISNLNRMRTHGSRVYSLEVGAITKKLEGQVAVVLADVPCSAQSLGSEADYPFHKSSINGNLLRQRRILSNAAPLVSSGGLLVYMTCTFSPKENEDNMKWFLKKHPSFSAETIPGYDALQSEFVDFACYRVWPHRRVQGCLLGRGGFVCVLKKEGELIDNTTFEWPEGIHSIDAEKSQVME